MKNHLHQVPINMAQIDLDNYSFYKREIYFKDDSKNENFIKVQYRIDTSYTRYEIQIMGVENKWNSNNLKNVIYFSYIPPYYFGKTNIYECPVYNHFNLINLNDINYILFGKLDKSNRISFIKKESISVWNYSLNQADLSIDNVTFLDRGKMKSEEPSKYLKNQALFKYIQNPKILLFNYFNQDYNTNTANYLKSNILYYDKSTNDFYFEFDKGLKLRDNDDDLIPYLETWIKFHHSRVRANYFE